MDKPILTVKVQTPREILYLGPALAVSSVNLEGKFDLLPQHANFISLVDKHPIIILKPDKQKVTFTFSQAIVFLVQNKVTVFADPQSHA